ncbi:MAG: type 1 glutamine amidotransferase [Deltaproteobacteria bacterium]|nr:MAG: type 1 glutamine amidotransferase [Deltaproteobacteria bacterium]
MARLRALLVSLRDPDDPMAAHEHTCFLEHSGLERDQLDMHPMIRGRPDPGRYDVIFFGGSGAYSVLDDTWWIRETIDVMVEVVDRKIPTYASCFGFQGLALALGGRVEQDASRAEMGSHHLHRSQAAADDPLFSILPERFWAQQGHKDHVMGLPEGVTLLAHGDGTHHQAFKVNRAPFWASQFHPELTVKTTVARFVHYAEHYLSPEEREPTLRLLKSGRDSPEVGQLLRRLCDIA